MLKHIFFDILKLMDRHENTKTIAALFDLDGVILDTEDQYTVFWEQTGRKYLDKTGCGLLLKGMTLPHIFEKYFENADITFDVLSDELENFEASMKMKYIPGALEFIKELKAHDIKLAIVTSSTRTKMQNVYNQCPELETLFDKILTSEDFSRSKPFPDCYLLGAQFFNTTPDCCFVFEDSINGLKAGAAAQMTVIGLETTNPKEKIEPYSSRIIKDFTEISYNELICSD